MADYRTVGWSLGSQASERCGWLVDWSRYGFAMITEKADSPPVGANVCPRPRPDVRGWDRPAVVRRVDALSDLLDLVGAECTPEAHAEGPDGNVAPGQAGEPSDHGQNEDQEVERRRSTRRPTDRTVRFRVARGHKPRAGRIVERSLDGLVIEAPARDAVRVGQRLHALAGTTADEFGFRAAVVRRVEERSPRQHRICAEIEA